MIKVINAIVIPVWLILFIWIFTETAFAGNPKLGEMKFNMNCKQCHGPAGMGMASYPKISGKDIEYTVDRLKRYRAGEEIGPNSALMIMMAKPLSDRDIDNLAAYLKEAKR
jgi:cytochrome c553